MTQVRSQVVVIVRWIPACAGMTRLKSGMHYQSVIPAKAGNQNILSRFIIPASQLVIPTFFLSFPRKRESSNRVKNYYVYLLASKRNGTLYVGVTNDLVRRVWEHKSDFVKGFTKKYQVHQLVWFEATENVEAAIIREKQIKKWNRAWKLELIEKMNPEWKDLYADICQ
jgi:putative endonuclease